jgi:hypothetical protein
MYVPPKQAKLRDISQTSSIPVLADKELHGPKGKEAMPKSL